MPPHALAYHPFVDDASFQRWLDDYVAAWNTYDAAAIGMLFAEDAVYRYHPWDGPGSELAGRESIVASWLGDRDDPGSWTAEYRPWLVAGDRAVAVGVSRYLGQDGETLEREYHNVFLCRFAADGRCSEFTELFMLRTD
jgi:ketosteroid isomerase-like protein